MATTITYDEELPPEFKVVNGQLVETYPSAPLTVPPSAPVVNVPASPTTTTPIAPVVTVQAPPAPPAQAKPQAAPTTTTPPAKTSSFSSWMNENQGTVQAVQKLLGENNTGAVPVLDTRSNNGRIESAPPAPSPAAKPGRASQIIGLIASAYTGGGAAGKTAVNAIAGSTK